MNRKPGLVTGNGLLVFARIVELSAVHGMDIQTVAMRYALERFLARVFARDLPSPADLSLDGASRMEVSQDTLTLKGGLTMFLAEGVHPLMGRSTSDADFHVAPTMNGSHVEEFVAFLGKALDRYPGGLDDGLLFDMGTLDIERVKDGNVPGGKVTVHAQIGKFALKIRSDLAFDSRPVNERAVIVAYPTLLKGEATPSFEIRHTPWEFTVADKVQAMVRHGAGNYRLRDYYDLFVILSKDKVDLARLSDALRRTFDLYGSTMPSGVDDVPALGWDFVERKTPRWDEERKSKNYGDRAPSLQEVVEFLRGTLDPVFAGMAAEMEAEAAPRPF